MKSQDLNYREVILPINGTHIEYLNAINDIYINGKVLFRSCTRVSTTTSPFPGEVSPGDREEILVNFFISKSTHPLLANLDIDNRDFTLPSYILYSTYEMEGGLIDILMRGGAYRKFSGSLDDARCLSRKFMEAIGYDFTIIYKISQAWSTWFFDGAWDTTFIAYNQMKKQWWILCLTDTD